MLIFFKTKRTLLIALILLLGTYLHVGEICAGENVAGDSSGEIIELYEQFLSTELKWDLKEKKTSLDYVTSVRPVLSRLEKMGDNVIEPIVRRLMEDWDNESISFEHEREIAKLFRQIGTPKAIEVLENMTLTRNKYWESRRSWTIWSDIYFEYLTQKKPLDSQTKLYLKELHLKYGVFPFFTMINLGVDIPFSQKWRTKLKEWSLSSQYYTRLDSIKYLCIDPNSMHIEENMDIIIESIDTVKDLPDADFCKGGPGAGIISDYIYYRLTYILPEKASDQACEYLFSKLKDLCGMARYCLAVTLAAHGDIRVKKELHTFLDNEDYWRFVSMRSRAIYILGKIGDISDIGLLQKIADSDPLLVYMFGGPWVHTINGKIINNDGPRASSFGLPGTSPEEALEKRVSLKKHPDKYKCYLIRDSAKNAIKEIEKRSSCNPNKK